MSRATRVQRSALLPFAAGRIAELVWQAEAYPRFLPGCTAAEVEAELGADQRQIALSFRLHGLSDRFTTLNRRHPDGGIDLELVRGPFRSLRGQWRFLALDAQACKVSLDLQLDFGSRVLEATLAPWIDRAINQVIEAFRLEAQRRADLPAAPA
ncbi:MAG TPA: type II toxin-antitoxin system RatA family toxin [Nevskiaceae bacterium]|nr:type II toxin-antitoxin system RatA family toxin [Nevskiaceae bacterium]